MDDEAVAINHWLGAHYIGHFEFDPRWLSPPSKETAAREESLKHARDLAVGFLTLGTVAERISAHICGDDVWDAEKSEINLRRLVKRQGIETFEGDHSRLALCMVQYQHPENEMARRGVFPLIWKSAWSWEDKQKLIAVGTMSNDRTLNLEKTCWDKVWACHRACTQVEARYPVATSDPGVRRKYAAQLRKQCLKNYGLRETTGRMFFTVGSTTGRVWTLLSKIFKGEYKTHDGKPGKKPKSPAAFRCINHLTTESLERWLEFIITGDWTIRQFATRLEVVKDINQARRNLMEYLIAKDHWHPTRSNLKSDWRACWKELVEICPPLNNNEFIHSGSLLAKESSGRRAGAVMATWLEKGASQFTTFTSRQELEVFLLSACVLSR